MQISSLLWFRYHVVINQSKSSPCQLLNYAVTFCFFPGEVACILYYCSFSCIHFNCMALLDIHYSFLLNFPHTDQSFSVVPFRLRKVFVLLVLLIIVWWTKLQTNTKRSRQFFGKDDRYKRAQYMDNDRSVWRSQYLVSLITIIRTTK